MVSEEDNVQKVFFSEADKQKLLDAASIDTAKKSAKMKGLHLKCFVELLFAYGWRKGELTGLQVRDVDLSRNELHLDTSKSGEGRDVRLTPRLRVLEPLVIGRKPNESLFPVKDIRWAWKRLCKEAGVKAGKAGGYVIHDTRRTTARTSDPHGVPETVINRTMGWKRDSKMLARYGIVDTADTLAAQQAQEQWEAEQRAKADKYTVKSQFHVPNQPTLPN